MNLGGQMAEVEFEGDKPKWPAEPEFGFTDEGEPVGWRVLDPDGNVVASGPGMTLEMVASFGDGPQEQSQEGNAHVGD